MAKKNEEGAKSASEAPEVAVSAAEAAPKVPEVDVAKVAAVPVGAVTTATVMAKISLYKGIAPAPVIGNYSFAREQGLSELKPGVHSMPRHVAEVLVDRGWAQFV